MLDKFHQPGHVPTERPHNLLALLVLGRLARPGAMDDVPVVGSRDQHFGVAQEIIELVESRQPTGTPHSHHRGPHFVPQHPVIDTCDIKRAIEKRLHRATDGREVDRGTYQNAVGGFHFLDPAVDLIIDLHTLLILHFGALTAGQTPSDRFVADVNNLRFNTLFFQLISDHLQGMKGIAFRIGTAIECYCLQNRTSIIENIPEYHLPIYNHLLYY